MRCSGMKSPLPLFRAKLFPRRSFTDYDAKYHDAASRLFIPARLEAHTAQRLRRRRLPFLRRWNAAALPGWFFCAARRRAGFQRAEYHSRIYGISMYPKLMEASGIPGEALMERLIALARARAFSER